MVLCDDVILFFKASGDKLQLKQKYPSASVYYDDPETEQNNTEDSYDSYNLKIYLYMNSGHDNWTLFVFL